MGTVKDYAQAILTIFLLVVVVWLMFFTLWSMFVWGA